jgi:hypothetical protein
MSKYEAADLADLIRGDLTKARIDLQQIGNGEWVVIVNTTTYVWSWDDWMKVLGSGGMKA